MSTVTNALPLPELYYHSIDGSYWAIDDSGKWIKINERSAMLAIRDAGYDQKGGGNISDAERCLRSIQRQQNVGYAGPLAGYQAGHYRIEENDVLVTESPKLIEPKSGDWPTLKSLFEAMFADPEHDQLPYFYGWLKRSMETMRDGRWTPGQVLAMAGPVGSGKSLTQQLITKLLGGRSAKPYQYMIGSTPFNGDLFRAEHLMVEDEAESSDIRARRHFAANIKATAVNKTHHCHGKHKQALTLTPIWRMTVSLNDDPDRLDVLPPLDDDVADKIILLRVTPCTMPMPTNTPEEQDAFWQKLIEELPAFAAFLAEWKIPENLRSPRFGITHFHHPTFVEVLRSSTPEQRLLELIDAANIFEVRTGLATSSREIAVWEGTALRLEQTLTRESSPVKAQAAKLLTNLNRCGTYLGRLAHLPAEAGGRVNSRLVNGQRIWVIQPPPQQNRLPAEPTIIATEAEGRPPMPPASLALAA